MSRDSADRAWWRRKRFAIPLTLLLLSAYPTSVGPLAYAVERGWIPIAVAETYWVPLARLPDAAERLNTWCDDRVSQAWNRYEDYLEWCRRLGERDRKSEELHN